MFIEICVTSAGVTLDVPKSGAQQSHVLVKHEVHPQVADVVRLMYERIRQQHEEIGRLTAELL